MIELENPLTKRDLSDIKDALYKLNALQPLLELLGKLGQDTSEFSERIEFYKNVLTTIRTDLFAETP